MARRSNDAPPAGLPTRPGRKPVRVKWILLACLTTGLTGWGIWYFSAPARLTRQAAALVQKQPREAEQLAALVVDEYDPHYASAWLVRAQAFLLLNQPAEAMGSFSMIPQPELCSEQELLATARTAWSTHQPLLAELCVAAAVQSGSRTVELARWALETRTGHINKATLRELVAVLVASDSADPHDWKLVGLAYRNWGELGNELAAYQRAAALLENQETPQAIQAKRDLARLLIQLGEYAAAKPLVEKVRSSAARDLGDDVRHATLLRADGHVEDALVVLDEVLKQSARNFEARFLRGIINAERGRDQDAVEDLRVAVEQNPYHAAARYKLAISLNRIGQQMESTEQLAAHKKLYDAQIEVLAVSAKLREQPADTSLMQRLVQLHTILGQKALADQWSNAAAAAQPPGLKK